MGASLVNVHKKLRTGSESPNLKQRASEAIHDDFLRAAVRFTTDRLSSRKLQVTESLGNWQEWRTRGKSIREHTIQNLDYYLDQFSSNMEKAGGHVHFAADAAEALEITDRIVKAKNAKLVAKSKSMVSEELHINHVLEENGVECIETDLGERIVQLAHETPSHMIIPAIHKNRAQIKDLFEKESGETLTLETRVLAAYARRSLRKNFEDADIGMTGCNFAIAESGSLVIFSNEGNGRMVTTLPKTHIAIMGMERILPSWQDLEVMANLLPRSATGQKLTVYMTALTGPRRPLEMDGPEEVHVIVLDNGRSNILGDSEFVEVLNCIRCAACLNVCPVYRQVGGHTYGAVYSGPIGAVITPLLNPTSKSASELPFASSLCGACYEACPVKIPLHDMLVHLRRRHVEAGRAPIAEQTAYHGFGMVAGSPALYRAAGAAGRWVQLNVMPSSNSITTKEQVTSNNPVLGWTAYRDLPTPSASSFHALWKRKEAANGT